MTNQYDKVFEKLGLHSSADALYFFPRLYEDRRNLPKIMALSSGDMALIKVTLKTLVHDNPKPKLTLTRCILEDETGLISGIWFNQPYLKKVLKVGMSLIIKGKVDINQYTREKQISVSEFEIINSKDDSSLQPITPIYPLTAGVYQSQVRAAIKKLIKDKVPLMTDPLPDALVKTLELMPLKIAITQMHIPSSDDLLKKARTRHVFDEFFYLQLALAQRLSDQNTLYPGPILTPQDHLAETYIAQLPYTLTAAQKRVIREVASDIKSGTAMNRIIQGDVGSGKTDVAAMAALFAIQSGYNATLMAPTEILAEQHYIKLSARFASLGVPVYLLKGKMKKKEREQTIAQLNMSQNYLIVGTHALIEDPIVIPNLGMAIIDEQHRFGVMQRQILKKKGHSPHCLFLTATPIPRSLMLTVYGDLEKSLIDEMPPGRTPIQTAFLRPSKSEDVYQFCRNHIAQGRQVYIVFPLVEESEKLDLQAAINAFEDLKQTAFNGYSVGLIHGKMPPSQKQDVMAQFKNGTLQILVATTVIEVGIDVPNASLMVIHHAERFGLSQLHQLRGRVGRGPYQSYCFLIADPKSDTSRQRIKAMLDTTDGFKIAEYDLKIRGPGDMLGTRQSGLPEFKVANLVADQEILLTARKVAFHIIKNDPDLSDYTNRHIKKILTQTHGQFIQDQLN